MARHTPIVVIDPESRPEVVVYTGGIAEAHGKRYLAGRRGTVDGVRSVLLVGSSTWWVPETDVQTVIDAEDYAEQQRARITGVLRTTRHEDSQ